MIFAYIREILRIGTGRNTVSLVKEAATKCKELADEDRFYERLWYVFDRDDFPAKNYNEAFKAVGNEQRELNRRYKKKIGREVKIEIAHSNEAFELWYLLHYDFIDTGMSRRRYQKRLTEIMGEKYKKNDCGIYSRLEKLASETNGRKGQAFAITNARKLRKGLSKKERHNHNPSTTVDRLVEELNKHLKK